MTKQEKLVVQLEVERELFASRSQSTKDHDLAIDYLKTGGMPYNYKQYEYDLLDAAIYDFDTLCMDYYVNN